MQGLERDVFSPSRLGIPESAEMGFNILAGLEASMDGTTLLHGLYGAALRQLSRPAGYRAIRPQCALGVSPSTAIRWLQQVHRTGSAAPGRIGGYKPRTLIGIHRQWLLERCKVQDFTLRGLVSELLSAALWSTTARCGCSSTTRGSAIKKTHVRTVTFSVIVRWLPPLADAGARASRMRSLSLTPPSLARCFDEHLYAFR